MYSENFIKILEYITSRIDLGMIIKSFTSVGDIHTLKICDLKHAQAGYTISIDDISYEITSVDFANKLMVIEGTPAPTALYFELYPVYFYHGTARETATEMTGPDHANKFTPLIFLNEIFEEDADFDELSSIDREITPYLYALGQRPETKFSKDLQKLYVNPMRRLMEEWIKTAKRETNLIDMMEYKTKLVNYAKFGIYVNNTGVNANLFPIPLSGCSNNGTLKLYAKEECCEDACDTEDGLLSEDDEDLITQINDTLILN